MNNEPLYEGIPLRVHRFVLQNDWERLTDDQRKRWFPRTWRWVQRSKQGKVRPDRFEWDSN